MSSKEVTPETGINDTNTVSRILKVIRNYTLVEYIPLLHEQLIQFYALNRAVIWHPYKKYRHIAPFRVLTYKSHDINPNQRGTYVARIVLRELKHPERVGTNVVYEIQLLKPKEIKHEPKHKLVLVSRYGKRVLSGAYERTIFETPEEKLKQYLVFHLENSSATGRHWVSWYCFLIPKSETLKVKWIWCGSKRLVKTEETEV